MYELEDTILNYNFNNIEDLENTLYVKVIDDQKERYAKKEYLGNSLAIVKDPVLK